MSHSRDDFSCAENAGSWMANNGKDHEVLVTSRVRLARNVEGFPFKARLSEERSRELEAYIREELTRLQLASDQVYVSLEDVDGLDRELLLERHLISVEMARGSGPRGVAYSQSRHLSIMVNEEDHLRVQMLSPGENLAAILQEIQEVDEAFSSTLNFARHSRFGYLTSCPTNVGTGLRLSVMMHLPALVTSKEIEKEFNAAQKMKLAVRGFYGEGTSFVGDFFQVSNQVTLGKSCEHLLNDLLKVVPQICDHEREVRRILLEKHQNEVEDKVYRAYGVLTNARRITSQEALELISHLRLGVCLGLISEVNIKTLNELLVMTQPAHVQVLEGADLSEEERDCSRAGYLRKRLTAPHHPQD